VAHGPQPSGSRHKTDAPLPSPKTLVAPLLLCNCTRLASFPTTGHLIHPTSTPPILLPATSAAADHVLRPRRLPSVPAGHLPPPPWPPLPPSTSSLLPCRPPPPALSALPLLRTCRRATRWHGMDNTVGRRPAICRHDTNKERRTCARAATCSCCVVL
jgi:hypothetical protein